MVFGEGGGSEFITSLSAVANLCLHKIIYFAILNVSLPWQEASREDEIGIRNFLMLSSGEGHEELKESNGATSQ